MDTTRSAAVLEANAIVFDYGARGLATHVLHLDRGSCRFVGPADTYVAAGGVGGDPEDVGRWVAAYHHHAETGAQRPSLTGVRDTGGVR